MNRIAANIEKMRLQIADRVAQGLTTQAKVEETRKALDLEFDEYCKFQELKSLAAIEETLSQDEAQLIYNYLGNVPDQFNRQPVEVKVVLTKIYQELLERRLINR